MLSYVAICGIVLFTLFLTKLEWKQPEKDDVPPP
jgi:hypothetical protein